MAKTDHDFMAIAARLAVRGHGGAEPNPLVGCVITDRAGELAGWGYHRRCGGPHAEIEALRRAGPRARGGTVHVTLEPCNHTGRTGPCTEALINAQVARVVFARADPNPLAAGGADRLRSAGVRAERLEGESAAEALAAPFARRLLDRRPWVVAKWAQTNDGRITTRKGESRWISGEASRRLVHRERGRVDAIMTGIGTVKQDDPLLTARGVRVRRIARRVVIDPRLETPIESKLVRSVREAPITIFCAGDTTGREIAERRDALVARGAEVIDAPSAITSEIDLVRALEILAERHETTVLLVEAGQGLLTRLFRAHLVDETWVFIAPLISGDSEAIECVRGALAPIVPADDLALEPIDLRRRDDDLVARYLVRALAPR